MKRLAIICSVLMGFCVNAVAEDNTPSNDHRVTLEVSVEERDFILERMRRMLETLTSVQQTVILDSPENADNLVRNLVAYTTEEYPEGWYERMPEGFKAMEDRLNERWRILAENNTSDSKLILKNTVQVMATCNACHRSFKIGLE